MIDFSDYLKLKTIYTRELQAKPEDINKPGYNISVLNSILDVFGKQKLPMS